MSEKSTLVDVDEESLEEQTEAHAELSFQDFPHDYDADGSDRKEKSQTHNFTDFPHNAGSDDEEGDKVELLEADRKPPSFWSFDYYQQFFDVDTVEVLRRIWGSMLPLPKRNFLRTKIRPNPDLYGPFWICATLVFTTAIAGNLSNYLQTAGKDYHWNYEFNKVTVAATAIYCYWWLVPTALFGVLWWRGSQAGYGFLEIICVYGYSLAIYIPISILWVINVPALQWTLVILGACLSGGVLLLTFWPAVREDNKKIAIAIMVGIFIFHALLASGFLFYFFRVSSPQSSVSPSIKPLVNNTEHIRGEAHKEDFETAVENHPKQTLADITVRPPAPTVPEKVHSDIGEKASALEKPKEEEKLTTDNKNLPSPSKDARRKRHLAQR